MFYLFYTVNSPEGNLGYLSRIEEPQREAGPLPRSGRDVQIPPFRKFVESAHMPFVYPRHKPFHDRHRASVRMARELQFHVRVLGTDFLRMGATMYKFQTIKNKIF